MALSEMRNAGVSNLWNYLSWNTQAYEVMVSGNVAYYYTEIWCKRLRIAACSWIKQLSAETGHLVFATLHTTSAASTIDRIIDVFPSSQQVQIRMQLSTTLEGIICQTLIPRKGGKGRVCAMEILIGTMGVRNIIREGKTHLIINMLQAGVKDGMQTLNSALNKLVSSGDISPDDTLLKSSQPDELKSLMGGRA
jgi:Tfp pilus assembly pilus retraction ATPase PilT